MTTFDSDLFNILWSGDDDEWVWAMTTGSSVNNDAQQPHHLWLSSDHGRTFSDKYQDLLDLVKADRGSSFDDNFDKHHASVSRIFVHQTDPKRVLLWGDGFYLFSTSDAGQSFKAVPAPAGTYGMSHEVMPHPTQPDWLLTMALRKACYEGYFFQDCEQDLFYSNDFGLTWTNLTATAGGDIIGFSDFDWGYHNGDAKYKELFKETTIFAAGRVRHGTGMYTGASEDMHLYRSDDFFKTYEMLVACGEAFELVAGQVFVARPDRCPVDVKGNKITPKNAGFNDYITLYASSDGTNFGEVCMPTELSDEGYTMISQRDGRGLFLITDHGKELEPISNMYANGNITELFTMALRNVYFGFRRGAYPDVQAVHPIPGRYIVNQELSLNPATPYRVDDYNFDSVAVTKITHNAGASWDYITVDPANVHHSVCKASCSAGQNCYLHLHGASSWVQGVWGRPSLYAAENAPGLVMASGNLGPEKEGLVLDKDRLCTWLSRDGGITWTDVVDDLYIYEYINHGNAIVMAKFREEGPANELLVSLDQGDCWYSIDIVAETMRDTLFIDNIRVEPDGAAAIVHVTGNQHIKSGESETHTSVLLTVDLRDVLNGQDKSGAVVTVRSDCGDSDFEDWRVSAAQGGPLCVLGQQLTYRRPSKHTSPCLLRKNWEQPAPTVEECDCHLEDFYCEYGYEKFKSNTECVDLVSGSAPKCAAIEEKRYQPSKTHLRLAHHEQCPNLKDFIPDTDGRGNLPHGRDAWTPRPSPKKSSSHGWLWFLLLLLLGGAIFAAYKFVPDSFFAVVEPMIGGLLWVVDSVKRLWHRATDRGPEELGFERLGESNQDDVYAAP